MNRALMTFSPLQCSVPRASGDEPITEMVPLAGMDVFPAPAGMNRDSISRSFPSSGVPRASGDEPRSWK